jgi:predicted ATPase
MGFWKDVRELQRAMHAKVKAGAGKRALIEALQEQAIGADTVQSAPTSAVDKMLRGVGVNMPSSPELPARMTAAQYQQLLRSGQLPRRSK